MYLVIINYLFVKMEEIISFLLMVLLIIFIIFAVHSTVKLIFVNQTITLKYFIMKIAIMSLVIITGIISIL